METALAKVIAAALVIVDAFLDCFVDLGLSENGFDCCLENCGGGTAYLGTLTPCGEYLVAQLQALTVTLLELGANIFPGLGVQVLPGVNC
jgi:hypothetical protein